MEQVNLVFRPPLSCGTDRVPEQKSEFYPALFARPSGLSDVIPKGHSGLGTAELVCPVSIDSR